MSQRMGFEGQVYFSDTPGATAGTLLENATDLAYNMDLSTGSTTTRGDGSVPPIETESTTGRKLSCEWTMVNDDDDAAYAALMAAVMAGDGIALRMKDYSAGKGFDGDVIVKADHGMPLGGEQTTKFTGTPTRAYGRAPQSYV